MTLRTRLTRMLGIEHPILLAPMGGVSGGRLAAAVSEAGGPGIIGGGLARAGLAGRGPGGRPQSPLRNGGLHLSPP